MLGSTRQKTCKGSSMKKKTTKRKENDNIHRKFTLSMSKNEAEKLWHTGCVSFLTTHLTRFFTIDESDIGPVAKKESKKAHFMYFCNSFLEAKILCTWLGKDSVILWDEHKNEYLVHSPKAWRGLEWFSKPCQESPI